MFTAWTQTLFSNIASRFADKVLQQFTFSKNTALEEVSNSLATLTGSASISGNKLVQTNQNSFMSFAPGVLLGANEDFTIECKFRFSGLGTGGGCLVGVWNNNTGTNNAWRLYLSTTDFPTFVVYPNGNSTGSFTLSTGYSIARNTDHHIAIVRSAGVVRMYLDGNLAVGAATFTGSALNSTMPCRTSWSTNTSIVGSIWDIRIGKGVYYSDSYTPGPL